MDWREAPGQKRMAISSADGSARSARRLHAGSGGSGQQGMVQHFAATLSPS